VYDEAFPVKAEDFSATHARISTAIFFECELYPEILRVGTAISGSLHYDEAESAVLAETAGGVSTRIFLGRFTINATCFWATELFPNKPVFLFSANGVF
jgi:hypothetical protein